MTGLIHWVVMPRFHVICFLIGEACPHVPGLRKLDWPLEDPKVMFCLDSSIRAIQHKDEHCEVHDCAVIRKKVMAAGKASAESKGNSR